MIVFTGDKNDIYYKVHFPDSPSSSLKAMKNITDQLLLVSLPLSLPFTLDTHALINTIPIFNHALAFYDVRGSDDTFLDMLMVLAPKFKGR